MSQLIFKFFSLNNTLIKAIIDPISSEIGIENNLTFSV